MAHFNVYRSRGGYGFEVTSPVGRTRGWRPTRGWAKSVAQREVLDQMDIEPTARPAFTSPSYDRTLGISTRKQRGRQNRTRRRKGQSRQRLRLVGAIAIVLVVLVVAAVGWRRWRAENSSAAAGPRTVTIAVTDRLKPTMFLIIDAFKKAHPDVGVSVWFGNPNEFFKEIGKGDVADLYIDNTNNFGWFGAYEAVALPAAFGFDTMQLVVPSANPNKIGSLQDIAKGTKYKVALCNQFNACGAAVKPAYAAAGLEAPAPALETTTPNAVIDAVATGKVDAGLVYRTDLAGHKVPAATAIDLSDPKFYRDTYTVRAAKVTSGSSVFLDFVTNSAEAVEALAAMGLVAR